MSELLLTVTVLLACAALLIDRRRLARRARDLELAYNLLCEHEAALRVFVNDIDAPEGLRRVVLDVADALDREAKVRSLADQLIHGARIAQNGNSIELELDALAHTRPDLRDAFVQAVATGFVASLLRFESTAGLFHRAAASLAAHPKSANSIAVAGAGGWLDPEDSPARWNTAVAAA